MKHMVLCGCVVGFVLGGCPGNLGDATQTGPVQARIAASATRGPAPLTVFFTGAQSTSRNSGVLEYAWDFRDGGTAEGVTTTHTFEQPGRYLVRLEVRDATGARGVTTSEIRIEGAGLNARIDASATRGAIPLTVAFSAAASETFGDRILDYYWDFGDGTTSRAVAPQHTYTRAGVFSATVRIVSGGGLESTAAVTIEVGARTASLQFGGTAVATLPIDLPAGEPRRALTFEAWVKAAGAGGAIAVLGSGLALEVAPGGGGLRLRTGISTTDFPYHALVGTWRHVAVAREPVADTGDPDNPPAEGTYTVYVDAVALGSVPVATAPVIDGLSLGVGFAGQLAEIRYWNVARTAAELAARKDRRIDDFEATLHGYWRLDEGSGQIVRARSAARDGLLGLSINVEASDPVWNNEGPPVR